MLLFIFYIILFALICLVSIKKVRYGKKIKLTSANVTKALDEYAQLCNPGRDYTISERRDFRDKYYTLKETCQTLDQSKWLSHKQKDKSKLHDFIKIYDNLDALFDRNTKLRAAVLEINERAPHLNNELWGKYLAEAHYFSYSESKILESFSDGFIKNYAIVTNSNSSKYLANEELCRSLDSYLTNLESTRFSHNQKYEKQEEERCKEFFDTVLAYPLDEQQRKSIVKLEDNCLVVSSAGSGKTSTMVGKIQYLVNKLGYDPSRILTITYTRKAAQELSLRLSNDKLKCLTFHKLALDIIADTTGKKPTIADANRMLSVFNELMSTPDFLSSVVSYLDYYRSDIKNPEDYSSAAEYYADRKKYGIQAAYKDMDGKTIYTKSEEEKQICNFLTHWGINFRYEEKYEIDTVTPEFRQYIPDFTIHYKDFSGRDRKIYLEHFGIDANGNVPKWFGDGVPGGWEEANKKYREGIKWKLKLHKDNNTTLIYTYSANFRDGSVENRLKNALFRLGVPIRELKPDELFNKIAGNDKTVEKSIFKLAEAFVQLLKSNCKTIDDIVDAAREKESLRDIYIIENIMKPFFIAYQDALYGRDEIDFTDAIIMATEICSKGKWKQYDFILVDEFQDISIDRYRFLKSLRSTNPMTKLFCVGDDWQSIYRFSGSDVALFSDFKDYFGYTEISRIETTYRFGEPLIGLSSDYIQRNPSQIRKNIKPRSKDVCTVLSFEPYVEDKEYETIEKILLSIQETDSIYIIGRYSFDVNVLDRNHVGRIKVNTADGSISVKFGERVVPYLTIHSSKGLEADVVIMINCNSGQFGFPSMISDDQVLNYLLSKTDNYDYGEERRVFYVGITRAKKHTYVLYDDKKPSLFVSEFLDIEKPEDFKLCPMCKSGHLVEIKRGIAKNGTEYINWGCSNHEAGCPYFNREFRNKS